MRLTDDYKRLHCLFGDLCDHPAARIDGLDRQFPEQNILISPWAYEALDDHRQKFNMISLGSVKIRGKNEPVEIWAVQGVV